MALYGTAINSGLSVANLAISGRNAATLAAFNESYALTAQKYNALNAKTTAEGNIAAITQDEILTNVNIKRSADEAKANAAVSAAVAGVSGSSVDTGVYQINANAARATQQAEATAEQAKENELSAISNAQSTYNSTQNYEGISTTASVVQGVGTAVSSLSSQDFKDVKAAWSN